MMPSGSIDEGALRNNDNGEIEIGFDVAGRVCAAANRSTKVNDAQKTGTLYSVNVESMVRQVKVPWCAPLPMMVLVMRCHVTCHDNAKLDEQIAGPS